MLLLMIANIKTNPNGLILPGGYMMHIETTWTFLLSPVTTCVPCLPLSYRKILSIINTVTSHMSLFNHSKTVRARDLKFWDNNHHILCVMCLVSHVTCQISLGTFNVSHFLFFVLQSGIVNSACLTCAGSIILKYTPLNKKSHIRVEFGHLCVCDSGVPILYHE